MSDVHQAQEPSNQRLPGGDRPVPEDRVDPNVQIPAAIRAQAQQAEELYRQVMASADETLEPVETALENGGNEDQNPQEKPIEAALSTPKEPQQAQPAEKKAQETQPVQAKPDEQSFEHRYYSMKGRYDRSQERIRHLEGLLATVNTQPQPQNTPQPTHKNSDLSFERLVTPEEEETYGKDFLSVVEKRAKETFAPYIRELESKIEQLNGQVQGVGTVVTRDAKSKMYETLDREVPNWREMDNDPAFTDWLSLPDVLSGEMRYNLLQQALNACDTRRVLAFFKGFLAEEAALAPVSAAPAPQPAPEQPRRDLRQYAAPGRAKSAAVNPPAEKPVYTTAQIAGFYADLRTGKYRGREAEAHRLEQDIFAAQREGRVR